MRRFCGGGGLSCPGEGLLCPGEVDGPRFSGLVDFCLLTPLAFLAAEAKQTVADVLGSAALVPVRLPQVLHERCQAFPVGECNTLGAAQRRLQKRTSALLKPVFIVAGVLPQVLTTVVGERQAHQWRRHRGQGSSAVASCRRRFIATGGQARAGRFHRVDLDASARRPGALEKRERLVGAPRRDSALLPSVLVESLEGADAQLLSQQRLRRLRAFRALFGRAGGRERLALEIRTEENGRSWSRSPPRSVAGSDHPIDAKQMASDGFVRGKGPQVRAISRRHLEQLLRVGKDVLQRPTPLLRSAGEASIVFTVTVAVRIAVAVVVAIRLPLSSFLPFPRTALDVGLEASPPLGWTRSSRLRLIPPWRCRLGVCLALPLALLVGHGLPLSGRESDSLPLQLQPFAVGSAKLLVQNGEKKATVVHQPGRQAALLSLALPN
eukprot:scaffold451_cov208-Pinguiococcus_pyrenoidosus.AAC.2